VLLYHKSVNVLLVGLGNASWIYAEQNPNLRFKTHTHSINFLSKLKLVAGCEVNKELASAWSAKFGLPAFSKLSQVSLDIDLVVIAVNHAKLLDLTLEALERWPDARVLVEKPFVVTETQLDLVEKLKANDLRRIWVNFPRNFQPETEVLKRLILEHLQLGVDEALNWNGKYSGGFLNTSSHFISLMNYLFGGYQLELLPGDEEFGMTYTIKGPFVKGLMLEVDGPISTGSVVVSGTGFKVDYMDGGEEILVTTKKHGEFGIQSTRSTYQLEVYRRLLQIWEGSENNLGTLSSELHNLRQIIYLQKSREVDRGPSN